ncbi:type IV secretion system DNA-binding domain-containing protein [Acidithiobacillus ferrooxidans]|uniref:type IV secretion system DNA-binding domain-containing protein n=1 Tax=Acidithiobacillus ferrooxidans TaxID=920 RepID=UPI00214C554D|nr:type IV secretion system DNA-binding domain-containing protein [Acidithiobacillus ferrooxidans]MCR2830464.1 type IV secretion system DNA-binding domain-containing protein [Acidithiobacillus ferrooxidans]
MKIKFHLWAYYVIYILCILAVYQSKTQYTGLTIMFFGMIWTSIIYTQHVEDKNTDITLQSHWRHYVAGLSLILIGVIANVIPFLGMLLSFAFIYWLFFWTKRNSSTDEYHKIIRGTNVEDKTKSKKSNNDLIHIGAVEIPREIEPSHFLIAGGVGSGKSVAISEFLDAARKRKQRAIVYDPTGEFVARYYKKCDIILNPFDKRNSFWTPFLDVKSAIQIESFASSLIPEGNAGTEPFWHLAPRAILSAVLSKVTTMRELNYLIFSADEKILIDVVKAAGKIGQVGSSETFKNVRAQLTAVCSSLRYIKDQENAEPISLSKFIQDDSDSWLFMSSQADYRDELKPLISTWLDILIKKSLSLSVNKDRRLWFILDEAASLQKISAIQTGMAQGRKYGLSFILGLQTVSQFYETYGKYGGETMLDLPQTKILMRLTNPETAKWASDLIGSRHVLRRTESESNGRQSSTSISDQHATEQAILPSQIQKLANLTGYIKMPDSDVFKFEQKYRKREEIAKAFIDNNLTPFIHVASADDDDKDKSNDKKPKKQANSIPEI